MFNKSFLLFWILTGLFVVLLSHLLFLSVAWNNEAPENGVSVDISLPVINWDEYLQLSKSLK